jgi:hypothetical protein
LNFYVHRNGNIVVHKGETMPSNSKSFFTMTPEEKEAYCRGLEPSVPFQKTKPLSAEEKRIWKEVKRGRGRPKKSIDAKSVAIRVTFDPQLLKAIDENAARQGISRAQFLANSAKRFISKKLRHSA